MPGLDTSSSRPHGLMRHLCPLHTFWGRDAASPSSPIHFEDMMPHFCPHDAKSPSSFIQIEDVMPHLVLKMYGEDKDAASLHQCPALGFIQQTLKLLSKYNRISRYKLIITSLSCFCCCCFISLLNKRIQIEKSFSRRNSKSLNEK